MKKKSKKAKKQARKALKAKRSVSASSIVRIPLPANKPWELSREEVVLMKNLVCKGASDEEFQMCMARARHHKLDPLRKQIWFVPRWDRNAENADGSVGRKAWVAQVGIDGLRHIAARDHANDYGTEDDACYGPMIEIPYKNQKLKVPSSASVAVWRRGATRPTVGTVFWEEIYPNVDYAPLVRQMPRLMLGKCAAAQANRKAYPETGGLYIAEEFAGRRPDYTPEGRLITYKDEDIPVDGSHEAAVDAGQRKIAELREKMAKPVEAVPEPPIEKSLPPMPEHDDIDDVWPKNQEHSTSSPAKETPTSFTPQGSTAAKGRGGSSPRPTPAAAPPETLTGIIQQANPNAGTKPRLDVLLKNGKVSQWMSAWNRDHWPHLTKGKGQEAVLHVERKVKGDKTFTNIVGLVRVGPVEFDTDGKTPIIQQSTREAGGKTLYD